VVGFSWLWLVGNAVGWLDAVGIWWCQEYLLPLPREKNFHRQLVGWSACWLLVYLPNMLICTQLYALVGRLVGWSIKRQEYF
jgi:hypothetical protein